MPSSHPPAPSAPSDETLRQALLDLARRRGAERTFCPSEVARAVAPDWRPLLARIREVAEELVKSGRLRCTQRGEEADPLTARGPIRLRWIDT